MQQTLNVISGLNDTPTVTVLVYHLVKEGDLIEGPRLEGGLLQGSFYSVPGLRLFRPILRLFSFRCSYGRLKVSESWDWIIRISLFLRTACFG